MEVSKIVAKIATWAGFNMRATKQETAPTSRKHIRITYWTDRITVVYYGDDGRKMTRRSYPHAAAIRVRASARARGYRVI